MYPRWRSQTNKVTYPNNTKEKDRVFSRFLYHCYFSFYCLLLMHKMQRKHKVNRRCAGSFERLTEHLVPIVAVGVFLRRWAIDRAAIRRWRRHTRCIRAADGWQTAHHAWLLFVVVVLVVRARVWHEACSKKLKDTFIILNSSRRMKWKRIFTQEKKASPVVNLLEF